MPQLSIVVATYNSGKTLKSALVSVFTQTFQDWECIVVDGASTDNTLDIIKEFANKDKRFRYVSEPDKGIYDAFNKGWRMARGEWIHYLGSDDKLTVNGIAELMATSHENIEIMSGHCYIEKIDGTIKPSISNGFEGCHQGKLVRKTTLERFGGFDLHYSILADYDLNIRMEKASVKIVNVNTYVAYFAMAGISQSINNLLKRTKELYQIYKANSISMPLYRSVEIGIRQCLSIVYRKFLAITYNLTRRIK